MAPLASAERLQRNIEVATGQSRILTVAVVVVVAAPAVLEPLQSPRCPHRQAGRPQQSAITGGDLVHIHATTVAPVHLSRVAHLSCLTRPGSCSATTYAIRPKRPCVASTTHRIRSRLVRIVPVGTSRTVDLCMVSAQFNYSSRLRSFLVNVSICCMRTFSLNS